MSMKALVAGTGIAGTASAEVLLARGAEVTVYDRADGPALEALRAAGARVVHGEDPPLAVLDEVTDVVLSPGFAPHHPLAAAAVARGLDVYCEPELAWRIRPEGGAPWLALTGTNGKTTVVTMLAAILSAAGLHTAALGNFGVPLVTAVDAGYDVLAVELSSFQLYWSRDMAPEAGAILNLAEDHLEWHGDFASYTAAKSNIWRAGVCIGNLDDGLTAAALAEAKGLHVGFTLEHPPAGSFGVIDDALVDRTGPEPVELCRVSDVHVPGRHNVANALAAATLARLHGVKPAAIAAGLRGYTPEPHRIAHIATVGGVGYVDDSKATSPHAANVSLAAYERIVWIAGGQLKGVDVDELVATHAHRLQGVVLLGVDRAELAAAVAKHAPGVPIVDVATTAPEEAMTEAVTAAARMARDGDTVLLAPVGASKDMYRGYPHRGTAFAEAVEVLSR
ncbi:MAG TPA: UDP-N-acetylmuramoyl-L-alanine--D-glutamate ligase [Phytomonospora sp.]